IMAGKTSYDRSIGKRASYHPKFYFDDEYAAQLFGQHRDAEKTREERSRQKTYFNTDLVGRTDEVFSYAQHNVLKTIIVTDNVYVYACTLEEGYPLNMWKNTWILSIDYGVLLQTL